MTLGEEAAEKRRALLTTELLTELQRHNIGLVADMAWEIERLRRIIAEIEEDAKGLP